MAMSPYFPDFAGMLDGTTPGVAQTGSSSPYFDQFWQQLSGASGMPKPGVVPTQFPGMMDNNGKPPGGRF
jgi:hypothetical protein